MALVSRQKKVLLAVLLFDVLALAVLLYSNYIIVAASPTQFIAATAPTSSMALIFGGGMKNATEMSDMQWDRVEVGAALYRTGRVSRLMITGDDGAFRGDEITAMYNRLQTLGVATSSILIDPHGYRTYESCWREGKIYGVTSTIVVSQSFHLPRIHYLCRHFGITTIGVAADVRHYDSWWVANAREWLARLKAVLQVNVTKPMPRVSS